MIMNQDQVSLSALLRSKPVPSSWAALFAFGRDYVWNQENGWALYGLMQALKAQSNTEDAALVEARFKKAWARADVQLTASRFGR